MARTVEDIILRLGIQGFENLDSVRGAFRQLSRVTHATESDINLARKAILDYANASNTTTKVIDAQIAGLKSLQGQAVINSRTYAQLGSDIEALKSRFTGVTQEVQRQTTVLDRQGSRVFGTSIASIKRYTESLRSTRAELAATSRSISETTADVDRLNTSLKAVDNFKLDINVDTTQVTQARGKVASAFAFMKRMAEQAATPVGATGRIFEGITAGVIAGQAAGPGAAMFGAGASTIAGLSGRAADLQTGLNKLSSLFGGDLGDKVLGGLAEKLAASSAEFANFQNRIQSLGDIVNSFTSALSGISPTAAVATGSVITAMAFMRQRVGSELDAVRADIDASFVAITDDIQKLIVELSRLGDYIGRMSMAEIGQQLNRARESFANVPAGSPRSRSFASQIAGLESVQRGEARAQATVLEEYRERVRGSSVTVEGLNERLQYLQQRMVGVNRATAEGAAEFRGLATEATQLQARITELGRMPTNYAVFAIRQRMAAQRETLAQSGFGAFSADVRTRFEGVGGARVEQGMAAYEQAKAALAAYQDAYDQMEQITRNHEATITDIQVRAAQERHNSLIDRLAATRLEKDQSKFEREIAAVDAYLQESDKVATRHRKMALALNLLGSEQITSTGLSGRELSPLYQNIVGLSTSALRGQRDFMGRSATEVYNDIVASFEQGHRTDLFSDRSRQVGEGIAQGVAKGAADSDALKKGSKSLVDKFLDFLFGDWGIQSPSKVSDQRVGVPIGQGIIKGTVDAIKAGRQQIQAALQFALDMPGKAPLVRPTGGPVSNVADKLQNFLIRSSARSSEILPYVRLLGEDVTRSAALPLATYRRAYERGGIVPPTFLPVEQRRGLRGTPGIPGAGLEETIRAEAMRIVSSTGAFVGPLAAPLRRNLQPSPAQLVGTAAGGTRAPGGAAALPLFGAQTPALRQRPGVYAPYDFGRFPIEGPLARGSRTGGRAGASASLREATAAYRAAVDNFWGGETGTFETLRRVVSTSAQVGASKLARRLTETRSRTESLSSAARGLIDSVSSPLTQLRTTVQGAAQQARTKLGSLDLTAVRGVVPAAQQLVNTALAPIQSVRSSISQAVAAASTGVRVGGLVDLALGGGAGGRGGAPRPPVGGAGGPAPTPPIDDGASAALDRFNTRLREFGPLNRQSINGLQDLRTVLDQVRGSLSPLDNDYNRVNQAIDRQAAAVDQELARRDRRRRQPLTGMQVAQGVGAALSGGIFGGPEGLIGGLGGLALGGVGGAFAGAAAGAQVGMFRQQLSGFADYAASLDRLKIALRGITRDQESYALAIATANAATRELNVPQEAAIGGMTRLSAAVLGAGGTVEHSAFAFRALSEAVIATKGNAEQVDGALLALTQVFSKGKVSAEELNQIAERLPGTFTLFAKAAGMTGPELTKALEQGKVGLNDLLSFLVLLRDKYADTALSIAASSQNAGQRLTVAYDNMRESVGRALQPLGADIQNNLANALRSATPVLVAFSQALVNNADTIGNLTKQAVALSAVLGTAFATTKLVKIATDLVSVAGGATSAATAMGRLTLAFAAVPGIGWIAAGVTALGLLTVELYNNNRAFKTWVDNFTSLIYSDFKKGWEDAVNITDMSLKAMASLWLGLDTLSATAATSIVNRFDNILGGTLTKLKNFWESLPAPLRQAMARDIAGGLVAPGNPVIAYMVNRGVAAARGEGGSQRPSAAPPRRTVTPPPPPLFAQLAGAVGAGAGRDAAKQQNDMFQQANELLNANLDLLIAQGKLKEEQARTDYGRAQIARDMAIAELNKRQAALDLQKKYNRILPEAYTKNTQALKVQLQTVEVQYNKTLEQIGEEVGALNEELFAGVGAPFDNRPINEFERALADLKRRVDLGAIKATRLGGPEAEAFLQRASALTTTDYQREATRDTATSLQKQIEELQRGKTEQTTLSTLIADYGDSWRNLEEPVRKHLEQLATTVDQLKEIQRYKQDPNVYAGLREGAQGYLESIGTLRSNIADLSQTGFKGVEDSITSLMTTGTANFREFATSLVADMTRIIVRQFIMRSLMQAIGFLAPSPAASGASGLSAPQLNFSAATANPLAFDPGTRLFAYGGAFDAANRIVPFAYGGVVNKPTMFKFADGGLMRNGVAGEAGPEAIMPLRRLPSGRLGVEAAGAAGTAAPINIVVNVDASGNQQSSGASGQGEALGRVIASAVRQEIINQRRPGGLIPT